MGNLWKDILVFRKLIGHLSNTLTSTTTLLLFIFKYFVLFGFCQHFKCILSWKCSRKAFYIRSVISEALDKWKFTWKKVYIQKKKNLVRNLNLIHSRNLHIPWISSQWQKLKIEVLLNLSNYSSNERNILLKNFVTKN